MALWGSIWGVLGAPWGVSFGSNFVWQVDHIPYRLYTEGEKKLSSGFREIGIFVEKLTDRHTHTDRHTDGQLGIRKAPLTALRAAELKSYRADSEKFGKMLKIGYGGSFWGVLGAPWGVSRGSNFFVEVDHIPYRLYAQL